jgi:hypothetical protein
LAKVIKEFSGIRPNGGGAMLDFQTLHDRVYVNYGNYKALKP